MAKNDREIVKSGVSCILSAEGDVRERAARGPGDVRERSLGKPYSGGRPRRGQATGWEGHRTFNTSLALDVDQYDEVCDLAKKEGVTIKVIMYELLKIGLLNYKSR